MIINPLAQMFTNLNTTLEHPVRYAITTTAQQPDSAEFLIRSVFDKAIEDDSLDNNIAAFRPAFTLTVENAEPLPAQNLYVWFDIKSVISHHDTVYKDSIQVSVDQKELNSKDGFTVRTAPNPFKPGQEEVVIEYEVPEPKGSLEIVIIDAAGRLVRRWDNGVLNPAPGLHRIASGWDGRNDRGVQVSRGVYLCFLRADGALKASWIMAAR